MAKSSTKKTTPAAADNATPSMLSFVRGLSAGNMLMFSTSSDSMDSPVNPILIRKEPLRGLKGYTSTEEAEMGEAILSVVETAELRAGDDTLVLKGSFAVLNTLEAPHSNNAKGFAERHRAVIAEAVATGVVTKLAVRYAINMACGMWGWRNATSADEIVVNLSWKDRTTGAPLSVTFKDLLLNQEDTFNLDCPEYAAHKENISVLAAEIESAMTRKGGFGTIFAAESRMHMGMGARVYPSQEWASKSFAKTSEQEWGGSGVTRILAKLPLANGEFQSMMNERKVGNKLRVVDIEYEGATKGTPIAIEAYGGNSHQGVAFRKASKDSIFGMVTAVASGEALTESELTYYVASCMRGGVYGSKDKTGKDSDAVSAADSESLNDRE